jgi:hypothetical protein
MVHSFIDFKLNNHNNDFSIEDYSIAKANTLRYDGGKTLEMIMVDTKEAAIAYEVDSL